MCSAGRVPRRWRGALLPESAQTRFEILESAKRPVSAVADFTEVRDVVEVITGPVARPNPGWLAFVRTGKARSNIRHFLKTMQYEESASLGERLLDRLQHGDRWAVLCRCRLPDISP